MADAELALVNKVDLKIALANTDKQLEASLKLYLAPLLLKLGSPHSSVREAILQIIKNVTTRIDASRTIKLPAEALLSQIKSPKLPDSSATTIRLYCFLFVSRAIDRMLQEERYALVPNVIHGISETANTPVVASKMFSLFCKLIKGIKVENEQETEKWLGILDWANHPQDETYLAERIGKYFMIQPVATATTLPGLSLADMQYFSNGGGEFIKHDIGAAKKDLMEFLRLGFDKKNLAIPLLIASGDSSSAIKDPAEMLYRKLNVDLENEEFIASMISLFVGDGQTPPCNSVLQERIVSQLVRSVAATRNKDIAKVSNLGLSSDNAKLKLATIQFIKWTSVQLESIESMTEFNTNIARRLKENILNDGWPKAHASGKLYSAAVNQRQAQYETLANVLKTAPQLFLQDTTYIDFLFDSLEGDEIELRLTIQEGLSGLTVFLSELSNEAKLKVKELAHKYLLADGTEDNIHACRFTILKYVNCAFPFEDSEARYLNILGTSKQNRPETIEEASRGLHPHWFNINVSSNTNKFVKTLELLGHGNKINFPDFGDFVSLLESSMENNDTILKSIGRAIEFAIQTLVMQTVSDANTVVVPDEDWEIRVDKAIEVDKKVRELLLRNIEKISQVPNNPFTRLLNIIFTAFEGQYSEFSPINKEVTFESTFLKMLSLSSSNIVENLLGLVDPFLKVLDERTLSDLSLSQVARSVGIIASHPSNLTQTINSLLEKLLAAELPPHKSKPNILVTGYLFSRLAFRNRTDAISSALFKVYTQRLLVCLKESTSYYQALECVGELAKYGLLSELEDNYISQVMELITPKVKKCDEKTVLAVSFISLANSFPAPPDGELSTIEQLVYDTHISKQTEYLFTSGEAFLILAVGWNSEILQRSIDIQNQAIKSSNSVRLSIILEKILLACANTKPSLRKAGCIWLLSIVDFCSTSPVIKENSARIHLTFMKFLADRDELVQESASRGLSLIYELGDVELKDTLVKGLLKSFTDTNSTSKLMSGTVDEDTELFDKDLLKTNDGSVSTYRDVLNLASDVGDPSLVYKFMSLAKSSALWTSRKGMAFGLGSILSKTSLDDMLAKNKTLANRLIPKLYRYRYDPGTSVSTSMNEIWNVLVDDSAKTIRDHFNDILNELLKGMGNKEWRVRQASTTAMNDLLNVVDFATYEPRLEEIWDMSFRVMDDIKESVRKEANKVTKLLANILTNNKQEGGLEKLIPFLLGNKGLLSDAEDIRGFALDTLFKLIKSSERNIKPYIPSLLGNFIALMSTLEPEIINYLVLNADKYNIKNNDIDARRLQSLGQSPMMDAIEQLINNLDDETIEESIKVIITSIKKSVGLPSKVCGSKVLVSLVSKKYELIKPYGDRLIKAAINQIKDRNDTISSSYTISIGYLSRLTSIDVLVQYGTQLKSMYFDSDNERDRLVAAIASENFSRYSNEKFESVASDFLPLTFIGLNDVDKEVAKVFEKQWVETTSGTNVLKLYLDEVVSLISVHIKSQNYHIRQTLAKSIVKLTNDINDFSNLSNGLIVKIFDSLIESCKGKSWLGKEQILDALVNYSIKLDKYLSEHEDILDNVKKVVLTEGKRRNKEYQRHLIKIMGKFLHEFLEDELKDTYLDVMEKIINDEYGSDDDSDDDMDVDDRSNKRFNNNLNTKLEEEKLVYITNLFDSFTSKDLDIELFRLMKTSIHKLLKDKYKFEITWRSKISGNECFHKMISEIGGKEFEVQELFEIWKDLQHVCSDLNNIESVKMKYIRNSKAFIDYLENLHHLDEVQQIKDSLKVFESDSTVIKAELNKLFSS